MIDENVLDLIRSDAEAAALDDVIKTAVEPETAVLILPGCVSCVIYSAAPYMGLKVRVIEVAGEDAERLSAVFREDDDLSDLSGLCRTSVRVDKTHVVKGRRTAH